MELGKPLTQRRRSERVSDTLPVIIRGIDLLGQPFEERTSALNFNLHGCRYASKHHLPKNTWITLELARDPGRRSVRARVAWIQRPHSVREFFQIAVELETPGNIWGLDSAPSDWTAAAPAFPAASEDSEMSVKGSAEAANVTLASILERPASATAPAESSTAGDTSAAEHPLVRELTAELKRQADEAAASITARADGMMPELDRKLDDLRAENRVAEEFAGRLEQLRLAIEQEANARTGEPAAIAPVDIEGAVAECARRLERETALAREQWGELLQSSLDGAMRRLAEQIAQRSQDVLREAEERASHIEARIAPRIQRVPEVIRELELHLTQAEESLRLHRERLRQVADNGQREISAQATGALAELRAQFEAARAESLAKHAEEMNEGGARAAQAAAEAIAQTAEQYEAQARAGLAHLADESLSAAGRAIENTVADAARRFTERVGEESEARAARAGAQIESCAAETVSRSAARLQEAAEIAAASFGEVLRGLAEREAAIFSETSRGISGSRETELQESSNQMLRDFEDRASGFLQELHAQMDAELEASIRDGRAVLAGEFASTLDGFRAERDAWRSEWAASLEQMSVAAAEQFRGRLQADGDSWMAGSVQRLNEHGQNVIETLMLSADAALRDSCSRIFEGLAGAMRERNAVPAMGAGIAGFTPSLRDVPEAPIPHNEAAPGHVSA